MKTNHTLLGTICSNKKIIAGAASLAIVGGIAPALISAAHAVDNAPVAAPTTTLYTTVGPQYFTLSGLGNYLDDDYIEDIYIEDESVAEFYGAEPYVSDGTISYDDILYGSTNYEYPADDFACSMTPFACIQGKKIGETEIVIEYNNHTDYIALKSVELFPGAFASFGKVGGTIAGEGSLDGADSSLLKLRNVNSDSTVSAKITGDRSWTVTASEDADWYEDRAIFTWTIGDQLVGNGTYIYLVPVEGVDELAGIKSNEDKMEDAFVSIVRTIEDSIDPEGSQDDLYGVFFSREGNIADVWEDVFDYGPSTTFKVTLEHYDDLEEMPEHVRQEALSKLPENVSDLYVNAAIPNIYVCNDGECNKLGEFYRMAEDLTFTFDVSDVAETIADGYVRKWYALPYVFEEDSEGFDEVIEAEYDEENKTIAVTGPLGYYVFGYIDVEKPEEPEEPVAPLVPNTGTAPKQVAMVATATFAPLALIALGAVIARNKKKAATKLAKKHNHFE